MERISMSERPKLVIRQDLNNLVGVVDSPFTSTALSKDVSF